jgi:hypothetical protein
MTLCPASLVNPLDIQNFEQSLLAANGSAIRVLGETILNLRIDGHEFKIPCLVTEQVSELILGLSWMKEENIIWHVGRNWLLTREHRFAVHCQQRASLCRRIETPGDNELISGTHAVPLNMEISDKLRASQFERTDSRNLHLNEITDSSIYSSNPVNQQVVARDPDNGDVHPTPDLASQPCSEVHPSVDASDSPSKDMHLSCILAADRASESESGTGSRLFLSRELCRSLDLISGDVQVTNDLSTVDDFVVNQIDNVQNNFEVARKVMQRQAINRNVRYGVRVRPVLFKVRKKR